MPRPESIGSAPFPARGVRAGWQAGRSFTPPMRFPAFDRPAKAAINAVIPGNVGAVHGSDTGR